MTTLDPRQGQHRLNPRQTPLHVPLDLDRDVEPPLVPMPDTDADDLEQQEMKAGHIPRRDWGKLGEIHQRYQGAKRSGRLGDNLATFMKGYNRYRNVYMQPHGWQAALLDTFKTSKALLPPDQNRTYVSPTEKERPGAETQGHTVIDIEGNPF